MRGGPFQSCSRSGGRPTLLVVTAILGLLLQAGAIAHLDFSAHGFCPEHGELVDLVVQPQAPGGQALVDPHPDGVIGLHVPAPVTLSGFDDHCQLAQLAHQTGPAPVAVLPLRVVSGWRAPAEPETRAWTRASWLLRMAPKQSPPV